MNPGTVQASPAEKSLDLTNEEREYIKNQGTIQVSTIDEVAPLSYKNSAELPTGMFISILNYIEEMTALDFELSFYPSLGEIFDSQSDLILGLSSNYSSSDITLSDPFLEAETVLFMGAKLDPNELEDKRYAAIKGGKLPSDIKKENMIEYSTRKESLEAVEKGEADYGYGNEYSVTFYTIQNGYKNIITVPKGRENRRYAIGLFEEDPILLSILNKSIQSIDDKEMEHFILDMATSIEREITLMVVFENYWYLVVGVVLLIIILLSWIIFINQKHKKIIMKQNKQLMEKSRTDGLTGLFNIVTMREKIEKWLDNKDLSTKDALIVIDCDNFKRINDHYGHLAGNQALQYIAKVLTNIFQEDALIGRVGGDEFLLYLKNISSSSFVKKKFEKVLDLTDKRDKNFKLPLSIGIKTIHKSDTFNRLLNEADDAMYESKRKGGNQITIKFN